MPRRSGTSKRFVLAVDLGGTKVAVSLADSDGKLIATRTRPVDVSRPRAPIEQIVALSGEVADGRRAAAIGVAVPGLARRDGTVWAPNLPGWTRMPLARELEERLGMRAVVESDRNAAVLGESWRGAARGKHDAIVLIVGTGIGAGIVSGGRLIRGARELSGCAGWLVVTEEYDEEARRSGTLESRAAGPALGRAAAAAFGRAIAPEDLAKLARGGDPRAKAIFARSGRLLGYAVANLISLFDPEVIVLTGGTAGSADLFLDEMKRAALERAQPLSAPKVRIAVTRLGARANLVGVASLAWDLVNDGSKRRRGKE